ncbi:MAG: hypothetical protein M1444_04085, partial [Patescibacteria group bacterium]|nr:hypothetical protein [Patescibacteria group bacterium]
MNDIDKLIKELKDENIPDKEAEELAFLSKNLSNLYNFERSPVFKNKFLNQDTSFKNKFFLSKQIFAAAFLSFVLLLGFTSVVSAQNSLPGQPLYPVKKLSENIFSAINPSFKGEILKRRSEEIKNLSGKKDGADFHNTVDEYEKELEENKKINPEKMEESRKNLEEAKENSLDEHKKDLERVIIKTESRQDEVEKEDEGKRLNSPEDSRDSENHPGF